MAEKRRKYDLYYTLNIKISDGELGERRMDSMKKAMEKLTRDKQEIILLLIIEHAINEKVYDVSSSKLPYGIKCKKNTTKIDIDMLPRECRWILYKFLVKVNIE